MVAYLQQKRTFVLNEIIFISLYIYIYIYIYIFAFNSKYLYSIKSIFILTHKTLLLKKGYQKSYSGYILSFINVQLNALWSEVKNLVCKLDQYLRCDNGICMSWYCVCIITINKFIPRNSS